MARFSKGCLGPWVRAAEDLLFASPCVICGAGEAPICAGCRGEIAEASGVQCPRCALGVGPWEVAVDGCSWCRKKRLGFDEAVALGPYQGPIREICLRMKSVHGAWLARWVCDVLIEARGERLSEPGPAAVVPVPLHWSRRLLRGYNQSHALASRLAERLGLPLVPGLRRTVATPKLASKGRASRAGLMRGAFRVVKGSRIEGRTVLLIDDVLTTGATCGSAARALKTAGAAKVVAVVVGRAEGRT